MNVINANKLTKGAVRNFFSKMNGSKPKTADLIEDRSPYEGQGMGLVEADELLGFYGFSTFPGLNTDKTLHYLFGGIDDRFRHQAVHHQLIAGLIDQLKPGGSHQLIACLDKKSFDSNHPIGEDEFFWLQHGFADLDMQVSYQGPINYWAVENAHDFVVSEYLGGDGAINSELSDLYRSAYRGRVGIPDISVDFIERQLRTPDCHYLILYSEAELIGQVTIYINNEQCYVDSIHIKRRYWGTAAADKLTQSLFQFAEKKGCVSVSGTAASNNRPSCALMERFGLTPQYQLKRMVLNLS